MAAIVPLTNSPNQTLRVALPINGTSITLGLQLSWNRMGNFWALSISDAQGNQLLAGIPLVTGQWPAANILAPYRYLRIGSAYVINKSGSPINNPSDADLGTKFLLLWDDDPA